MGLFDDDFYSTKVSYRYRKPERFRKRYRPAPVWFAAGAAFILGVVVTLACVLPFSNGGASAEESALTVMAQPSQETNAEEQAAGEAKADYQKMIINAANKAQPSVVSIISGVREKGADETAVYGLGSGIIFEKSGGRALIVTNAHVIAAGEQIDAVLVSGERKRAEVVGRDVLTDLAVLEVDDDGIDRVAEFGDSTKVQAGETVIAIGNPLGLGYSHTITVGVISAPIREIDVSPQGSNSWKMNVIQTDAAINQGNSGGALVNLQGQVIGINSLKVLDLGVEGIGFAIPVHEAVPVIRELVEHGKVMRPYLGIYTQNVEDLPDRDELNLPKKVNTGIIVVEAVSPAKDAGLQSGDVIVALDGKTVRNTYELRMYLYENKQIGDPVEVTFYRGKERMETTVILGDMPAE